MKKEIIYLVLASLCFVIIGCSATKSSASEKKEAVAQKKEVNSNVNLIDRLRRYSGLSIRGDGQNAQIFLRGISSINNPREVLFIINGAQVGNFSRAASQLNPQEIKRIEVLKNPSDIASYGFMGSGGVVLITTE